MWVSLLHAVHMASREFFVRGLIINGWLVHLAWQLLVALHILRRVHAEVDHIWKKICV